ncbi:hypothetical protein NSA56_10415 [Oceanobacillus caeni]|nr:hypothetical protein [Oceanobacillus caeni]MCR1834811.1 hypothetical protein [Oceanobacillus caeni]
MNSRNYIELNHELIPTGKILVENTTFNFLRGCKLKDEISANSFQNWIVGNGYDHYFLFNPEEKGNVEVT